MLSPDRLEEIERTIEECHVAINKIKAKHLDLKSLLDTAITLLGNLEARWLTLSSLVLDKPLEYLTGKIQTLPSLKHWLMHYFLIIISHLLSVTPAASYSLWFSSPYGSLGSWVAVEPMVTSL